jgi:uncharacterized protein
MPNQSAVIIDEILRDCRVIAVVGLSSNPTRSFYEVASYIKAQGYRVIPARGVKSIWMQERVSNEQVAVRARASGRLVAMDRCWLKEHAGQLNRG